MKEKIRKILRRLTLFDWLAVLVVLAGAVFLSLFIFKEEKWTKVEVKINRAEWWMGEGKDPPYWLSDNFSKGEKGYDSLGRKIAEVLDVRSYEWGGNTRTIYLTLNLKTEVDKRKKILKFDHLPLQVGGPIELSLGKVGTKGLISYIEGVPDTRVKGERIVEARLIEWSPKFQDTWGIMPWRADAVKIGDKVVDKNGNVLAEILDKKEKQADRVVPSANGSLRLQSDPLNKDVFLTIKLKTIDQDGVDYFLDDYKVKVGQVIMLTLPEVDIWPEITKIDK